MLLEKSGEMLWKRMKRLSQCGNDAQLWLYLVVKVKSKAVRNSTYCVGT